MKLVLIRGLSGSGKSTLLNLFNQQINTQIDTFVSADDYFYNTKGEYLFVQEYLPNAHLHCQNRVRQEFKEGLCKGIAVHNTFSCRWEMEPYIKMAYEFGAQLIVIDLYDGGCTDEELSQRNIHKAPLETITRMRSRWEHDWSSANPIPPWERKEGTINDFPWEEKRES